MTSGNQKTTVDLDTLALRAALHVRVANTPDMTLDIDATALFLGMSKKALEKRRSQDQPPRPVRMHSDQHSGHRVMYRVGELLDFVRSKEPPAQSASAMPTYTSHTIINGKRSKPSSMAWIAGDAVQTDELEEPFFMTKDGLILAHGWEEDVATIAERLISGNSRIEWMTWERALTAVWQDDRLRLAWLKHADAVAPGLRSVVDDLRKRSLSQI